MVYELDTVWIRFRHDFDTSPASSKTGSDVFARFLIWFSDLQPSCFPSRAFPVAVLNRHQNRIKIANGKNLNDEKTIR